MTDEELELLFDAYRLAVLYGQANLSRRLFDMWRAYGGDERRIDLVGASMPLEQLSVEENR